MGGDAEQPQEGELDHAYRGALRVHVGELAGQGAGSGPAGQPEEGGWARGVSRQRVGVKGWGEKRAQWEPGD